MAQSSRVLVLEFARVCGLDPHRVRKLTLEADAKDGILVAHVVMYPEISTQDLASFVVEVEDAGDSMRLEIDDASE